MGVALKSGGSKKHEPCWHWLKSAFALFLSVWLWWLGLWACRCVWPKWSLWSSNNVLGLENECIFYPFAHCVYVALYWCNLTQQEAAFSLLFTWWRANWSSDDSYRNSCVPPTRRRFVHTVHSLVRILCKPLLQCTLGYLRLSWKALEFRQYL